MAIYMIQMANCGPVKIGHSDAVLWAKVKDMQVSHPYKLTLIRSFPGRGDMEAMCHFYFRDNHIRGEWFHYSSRMLTVTPEEIETEVGGVDRPLRIYRLKTWQREMGMSTYRNKHMPIITAPPGQVTA